MADRKSFVLYLDYIEQLEELSLEERGQLLTAIFYHVSGQPLPEMTTAAKVTFLFIRKALDRDAKKYEAVCERNRANGSKGGRPKKREAADANPAETQNNPVGSVGNPSETPESRYRERTSYGR